MYGFDVPKEIVGVGGELHTFFGSPRSCLLICVLRVCHLWGGNKVNLLWKAVCGISFTNKTWTFPFCSYLLYGRVTTCCIYCSFLVFLQIQSGVYFSIFTLDVTVFSCSAIFWFNWIHILAHVLEAVNKWIGITGTFTINISFNRCILAAICCVLCRKKGCMYGANTNAKCSRGNKTFIGLFCTWTQYSSDFLCCAPYIFLL